MHAEKDMFHDISSPRARMSQLSFQRPLLLCSRLTPWSTIFPYICSTEPSRHVSSISPLFSPCSRTGGSLMELQHLDTPSEAGHLKHCSSNLPHLNKPSNKPHQEVKEPASLRSGGNLAPPKNGGQESHERPKNQLCKQAA